MDDIAEIVATDEYATWGFRVIGKGDPIQVGPTDYQSRIWDDGSATDELLPGISAIRIHPDDIERALIHAIGGESLSEIDLGNYGYAGDRIALIKGNIAEYGQDRDEVILCDAEIVKIFSKIEAANAAANV